MSENNMNMLARYFTLMRNVENEVRKVIIGQKEALRSILICSMCERHILLEGVPGVGKTKTVRTLSMALGAAFQRVQGTSDLLPPDIIGTRVYHQDTETFDVEKGPIVTNLLLIDEINRIPPKAQSALLEAMQERQFTIGKETFAIARPFMVLATQNPIEQEGTYPLPEAQLDRFMMKVKVSYPSLEEELAIVDQQVIEGERSVEKVMECQDLVGLRDLILSRQDVVYVDPHIKRLIVDVVQHTRTYGREMLKGVPLVVLGASPRGSIYLTDAARSHAFLEGRDYVLPEDVVSVAPNVLRHRIILNPMADVDTEDVIRDVINEVRGYGN